jgi:hypothetical protein
MTARSKSEEMASEVTLRRSENVDVTQQPSAMSIGTTAKVIPLKVNEAPKEMDIPSEIEDRARVLIERYERNLKRSTEAYIERSNAELEAGEPTLASGYQYWNCLSAGPFQFFSDPPYRPSRIIAANELALMLGVVWINPLNSDGGGLPGTVVLGARNYRVRFETINMSTVTDGPDALFTGTFASPAPVVSVFPWWFIPPDPGVNPRLLETSVTVDIVEGGQPMAAFSTWHFNPDAEPPFLGLPASAAGFQYDIPARFLVYRK